MHQSPQSLRLRVPVANTCTECMRHKPNGYRATTTVVSEPQGDGTIALYAIHQFDTLDDKHQHLYDWTHRVFIGTMVVD